MLKKTLKEFVYGGHLLSIGASLIVLTSALVTSSKITWPALVIAYLSSQIVYNYDHLSDLWKSKGGGNTDRHSYLEKTKNYQIIVFVIYVFIFTITALHLPVQVAFLGTAIVLGGVLYTERAKDFTKKITGFKNIYIAFFWSLLAFFPYFQNDEVRNAAYPYLAFSFFVFVRWIINSSYFDFKDLSDDRKKELKTLPVAFGVEKTIVFLHVLNLISALIVIVSVYFGLMPFAASVLLVFVLYSAFYLAMTKRLTPEKLRVVSYVVVDGEYLFWPLVVWLVLFLISKI